VRRALLLLAAAAALACRKPAGDPGRLRLGYFPNVTHAQALVGVADGSLARALEGRLETRIFNAGPAAMEALVSGDLDASYVGPGPALVAFLRTGGESLRVIAGAASGGAVLVVARGVARPEDLRGRRVASPQLGNTQDIALRMWLRARGLSDRGGGGAVQVTPIANPDILSLFARGDLAGAWVPEPWGARLVALGGRILVDERTLWDGGRFPATVLVASTRALREKRPLALALLRGHVALTRRWSADPAGFAAAANDAFGRLTGKPLPPAILRDAFSPQLAREAHDAQDLGYAPPGDASGIVDASLLDEVARR